jgi:hypothetical protein
MSKFKSSPGFTIQTAFTELHRLLLVAKLSHYRTKKFPAHEAFGRTYDSILDLVDTITEQLVGYSGTDPGDMPVATITTREVTALADDLMLFANKLIAFAEEAGYPNIENLGQELSGVGAQLKYYNTCPALKCRFSSYGTRFVNASECFFG